MSAWFSHRFRSPVSLPNFWIQFGSLGCGLRLRYRSALHRSGLLRSPSQPTRQAGFRQICQHSAVDQTCWLDWIMNIVLWDYHHHSSLGYRVKDTNPGHFFVSGPCPRRNNRWISKTYGIERTWSQLCYIKSSHVGTAHVRFFEFFFLEKCDFSMSYNYRSKGDFHN